MSSETCTRPSTSAAVKRGARGEVASVQRKRSRARAPDAFNTVILNAPVSTNVSPWRSSGRWRPSGLPSSRFGMPLLPKSFRSGLGLTRMITPAPAVCWPSSFNAARPRYSIQYWSLAVVTTNACGKRDAVSIGASQYAPFFTALLTFASQPSSNFAWALKSPEPVPIVS
ncbi:MAG: hypothetical protein AUG91_08375 [Actinobacteria bacterium 13_1_20CM_4_69_9]|nr:MAG: hypothetical protein AUG91_08375 [Actinobacteria bacterium 13_1_20CM_4_69_9]